MLCKKPLGYEYKMNMKQMILCLYLSAIPKLLIIPMQIFQK